MLRFALPYLLLKAGDDTAAVASPDCSAGRAAAAHMESSHPVATGKQVAWHVTYGGSFNPFHVGHEQIARRLCGVSGVRRVVVIPAGRSPGRQPAADGVDALMPWEMRYEMAQVSLRPLVGTSAAECELLVSDIERPAPGGRPNFTWETMQRLMASGEEQALAGALTVRQRWAMVLGADQALHFHKWKDAGAILRAGVAIWVVPRSGKTATRITGPRRDAETVWAQIVSAVPRSEIAGEEQDAELLVWEGTTARGFVSKKHADHDWETMRWLGWDDVSTPASLCDGAAPCEEAPALSSSAIRRGELGIEAVAPAAREIWTRWQDSRLQQSASRRELRPGPEPESDPSGQGDMLRAVGAM